MKSRFALSRRTFLRGVLGTAAVSLALPTLEVMLNPNGDALAGGEPLPQRFLVWFFGNGVRLDQWVPGERGAGYQLSESLAPLATVKDYCSVLSGFYPAASFGASPHHSVGGILSGHAAIQLPESAVISTTFGGPSIDQVVASQIGQGNYLPSLEIGVSRSINANEGTTLTTISHKSPAQPVAPEMSPVQVYVRLIGMISQADRPIELRAGVLDAVDASLKRLKGRVGKADQARLDAHMASIELLEKQMLAQKQQCEGLTLPTQENVADAAGQEPLDDTSKTMSDLVRLAFACDITRVATFRQTAPQADTVFYMNGTHQGEHQITHGGSNGFGQVDAAVLFNMKCFAYLLEAMKNTGEGDGNMLDNLCALCTSEVAEGLDHSIFDTPMLVVGRAGGALKYPGEHYRSADDAGSAESTSDILLACAQAVAPAITEIGSGDGYSNTPCAALAPG